jgi:peroxiredoxin
VTATSLRTALIACVVGLAPAIRAHEGSDPGARVERCAAFYRQLDAVAATYKASIRVESMQMNLATEHEFIARRPNRISLVTSKGLGGGDAVCDGEQLYATLPMRKRYTLSPAPKSFEDWGQSVAATSIPAPGLEFVLQLLSERPMHRILGDLALVHQLEDEGVGGRACHRFAAEQSGHRVELWMETGEQPWVRRLRTVGAGPAIGPDATEIEMVFEFADWKTDAGDADPFAINPPGDFERADSLFPAETASAAAPPARRSAGGKSATRSGELAPSFELSLLGGGKLELGQHLGKDVIVLDFWATWCRPCVMGLPIISEVTGSLKDRGVVFYAINIAEKEAVIAKFMQRKEFDFPVAMDISGRTAKLFSVGPIPHTVIIGRDGKIAKVHVGFSSGLKARLTSELEALLGSSGG